MRNMKNTLKKSWRSKLPITSGFAKVAVLTRRKLRVNLQFSYPSEL